MESRNVSSWIKLINMILLIEMSLVSSSYSCTFNKLKLHFFFSQYCCLLYTSSLHFRYFFSYSILLVWMMMVRVQLLSQTFLCWPACIVSIGLAMMQQDASHPMITSSHLSSMLTPSSVCVSRLINFSTMSLISISSCSFKMPAGVWLRIMIGSSIFFLLISIRVSSSTNQSTIVKSVVARLSTCLTSQPHLIAISSLLSSITRLKSPHSFSTHQTYIGGGYFFLRYTDITVCLVLSRAFTKSTSTACEPIPCYHVYCDMLQNGIPSLARPAFGAALIFIGCLLIMNSFYALIFNTTLTILKPTLSKLILRQFLSL